MDTRELALICAAITCLIVIFYTFMVVDRAYAAKHLSKASRTWLKIMVVLLPVTGLIIIPAYRVNRHNR